MNSLEYISSNYNYVAFVLLIIIGFFTVVTSYNLVKKLMGLMIFQTGVLLVYIASAYVDGFNIPILTEGVENYVNPLPHVLMLTAIVVGISTVAVGLALVVRIKEEYGVIEDDDIINKDIEAISNPDIAEVTESKANIT